MHGASLTKGIVVMGWAGKCDWLETKFSRVVININPTVISEMRDDHPLQRDSLVRENWVA
jgi:hypothetical protein